MAPWIFLPAALPAGWIGVSEQFLPVNAAGDKQADK